MKNLGNLMKQAQAMQQKMAEMQERLGAANCTSARDRASGLHGRPEGRRGKPDVDRRHRGRCLTRQSSHGQC